MHETRRVTARDHLSSLALGLGPAADDRALSRSRGSIANILRVWRRYRSRLASLALNRSRATIQAGPCFSIANST